MNVLFVDRDRGEFQSSPGWRVEERVRGPLGPPAPLGHDLDDLFVERVVYVREHFAWGPLRWTVYVEEGDPDLVQRVEERAEAARCVGLFAAWLREGEVRG